MHARTVTATPAAGPAVARQGSLPRRLQSSPPVMQRAKTRRQRAQPMRRLLPACGRLCPLLRAALPDGWPIVAPWLSPGTAPLRKRRMELPCRLAATAINIPRKEGCARPARSKTGRMPWSLRPPAGMPRDGGVAGGATPGPVPPGSACMCARPDRNASTSKHGRQRRGRAAVSLGILSALLQKIRHVRWPLRPASARILGSDAALCACSHSAAHCRGPVRRPAPPGCSGSGSVFLPAGLPFPAPCVHAAPQGPCRACGPASPRGCLLRCAAARSDPPLRQEIARTRQHCHPDQPSRHARPCGRVGECPCVGFRSLPARTGTRPEAPRHSRDAIAARNHLELNVSL